jgi:hypothetical protein
MRRRSSTPSRQAGCQCCSKASKPGPASAPTGSGAGLDSRAGAGGAGSTSRPCSPHIRCRAEPSRRGLVILSVAVVAALVAVVGVGVAGLHDASMVAVQQEAVADGFDESSGALPDPYAEGDPVPTAAPDAPSPAAGCCTPGRAMMLLGEPDAATGHRAYSVTLMNFSDAPCAVEGYPDFAFADQKDHLLDVTIEHGGSFTATDRGLSEWRYRRRDRRSPIWGGILPRRAARSWPRSCMARNTRVRCEGRGE